LCLSRSSSKELELKIIDSNLSGAVHTRRESPQNELRDVWTCGMTLALAYVLYHLSVA